MNTKSTLNPNEAPLGFVAILKSEIPERTGDNANKNFCGFCDWRKQCNDPDTDLTIHRHRCMSSIMTVTETGKKVRRRDGCSVVFKREIDK